MYYNCKTANITLVKVMIYKKTFKDHINGNGSIWTKKYSTIKIEMLKKVKIRYKT